MNVYQILGFGPTGKPILPNTAHSNDPEVIRHEKMGWEEISIQASKIISFSGPLHCTISTLRARWIHFGPLTSRSCWTRAISQDHALWLDVWLSVMCHPDSWR